MLLTKILVALQILDHYVITGHPLALSKSFVKRGETRIPRILDALQRFEEHADQVESEEQKIRKKGGFLGGLCGCFGLKSSERETSREGLSAITSAMRQDASDMHAICNQHNFSPSDFIFGEDYISMSENFDHSEKRMLQTIVEKRLENKGVGNPFVQMNTLRSILNDNKAARVFFYFQKFPILLQSSVSDLNESQQTLNHCPAHDLIALFGISDFHGINKIENTATLFQNKIPKSHPAHHMKETISGECHALINFLDNDFKKGRLAKILLDDYTHIPPYSTQFLEDYYLNMNDFLSMLTNIEKETFWNFRESYEKYSGIEAINSMTIEQGKQLVASFLCNNAEDPLAFASMGIKMTSVSAENSSRRANHKKSMIILSNFDKSEINLFFRYLEHLLKNFYKAK
ncbi:hypothetical protein Pst134EA_033441 [Puccinia striiformis f. sp. tritici]|uniref:Uncharacterized protein n=1 Tax=Puccinia striiformis f. sp. tritici PST-78 TaxID=1165861 RepID=A0A0L0UQF0_9BASI|nr:hypothetical protein Pst134EA_033441 [Puccinia striiformis f. sp. tritici]KAH9465279.1 hypothetical protein Pst134EA_033441 [Puccinia striiformis f. sp. tritici]KAI9630635.1 hypothetical protein KEM48_013791 [Puccinia striiformis f. sp. tritici PST-130]KNE89151.1 hypothetical protein PSTG_17391 [Puccinia striiformis f. sp. tritici PST-78]